MIRKFALILCFAVAIPAHADRTISFVASKRFCSVKTFGMNAHITLYNPSTVNISGTTSVKLSYQNAVVTPPSGPAYSTTKTEESGVIPIFVAAKSVGHIVLRNLEPAAYCNGYATFWGDIKVTGDQGSLIGTGYLQTIDGMNTSWDAPGAIHQADFTLNGGQPF